jgi:L-asparagine oxygenase
MTVQIKHFTEEQKAALIDSFKSVISNPYAQYYEFKEEVKNLVKTLPDFMHNLCNSIINERKMDEVVHFIRNCPIDTNVEKFDYHNLSADKYDKKKTFISETFLQVFAELTDTPIFRYDTSGLIVQNSFFYEVYGIIQHKKPGHVKEVAWHNDENHNKVMADYLVLLGMRSCNVNLVFTSLIDCREVLKNLTPKVQETLRKKYYYDFSGKNDTPSFHSDIIIDKAPILIDAHCFRYCSTRTQCLPDSPVEARDALIALHDAIVKSPKERFQITEGDLLCFSNRHNLHNRDIIKIENWEEAHHRWLMKTFNFQDSHKAKEQSVYFVDNKPFVVRSEFTKS